MKIQVLGVVLISFLIFGKSQSATVDRGEEISPAFAVNTLQLTPAIEEGISPAFVVNTLQLTPITGEGVSDTFSLDTRGLNLPATDQIVQYLLGRSHLDPALLDVNGDGIITITDVIRNVNSGR